MALVTLLTDSGASDHYVAAIKARILGVNPSIKIVDISHQIPPCDIAHAAFVLKAVFRDFPDGTVHLVGVDATGNRGDALICVQLEQHFFIAADNGLLGLITDQTHQQVVELNTVSPLISSFPERDIFAPVAARLASGASLTDLGRPLTSFKKMLGRFVKATKKQIAGHVIRVDNFGNLITNIPKEAFDILSKDKTYTIQFGSERSRRIHANYHHTDQGECFLMFNSLGLLEIGIYKGNAQELLGLGYDSPVNITFEP